MTFDMQLSASTIEPWYKISNFVNVIDTHHSYNYCAFDVFCTFYSKWKCFVLIDHLLSETIFFFLFLRFVLKYLL